MNNQENDLRAEYGEQFLQPGELKARQCVYISIDTKETISYIVRMLGDRKLSIGTYVDNIFKQHFQDHKDEINGLCSKLTDKIIK